ncbi:MAG: membrane protein insertase YidC [Candidatus Mycalebacterium zealandia]|nr:MAG: membrane protein insertase YidC [Candidatus Mycalebacterium zealandia]
MQDEKLTSNYIIFAVLALGIIFGYSKLFPQPTGNPKPVVTEKTDALNTGGEMQAAPMDAQWEPPTLPAAARSGKTVEVQTSLYTAYVDTAGGTIKKLVLKNYSESPEDGSESLTLVGGKWSSPETVLSLENTNLPNPVPFEYKGETTVKVEGLAREIALSYEQNGFRIVKKLSFTPDTYMIGGKYEIENRSAKTAEYALHFLQRGKIEEADYGPTNALVVSVNGEKKQFNGGDDVGKPLTGGVDWLGFSKKYFIIAALPESGETTQVKTSTKDGREIKTRFSYGRFSIPSGAVSERKWKTYMGPKQENMLSAAGYGFENAIDYGWFGTLSKLAVRVLKYSNGFFDNYGVSIIVITVVFRLLFLPLSIKGMRSMKKMQKKMETLKPKLDALKEKFKDDKKRQNEEMMKLYSNHGINPLSSLGGCLPMLAQVPVFIALYYGLLYSIELRHSSFLWISDLSAAEMLFDVPGTSVPFRILPLAMGVSWWFSTKLTPIAAAGDTAAMQAKIMQFMPLVFTFVMWDFPSGLVLYWTASNVLSVAQQLYINRST